MSTEINTREVVHSMMSSFPSGNDTECLSKQELLSGSSNLMNVSGGDTECVPLANIDFKPYVCKSATDKTPLTKADYPYLQSDTTVNKDGHVLFLTGTVNEVYVTTTANGLTFGPTKLKLNEVVAIMSYGGCHFLGNRIVVIGLADLAFIINSELHIRVKYVYEIDGNQIIIEYEN